MDRAEAIKRLEWLRMVGNHVDSVTLGSEDMGYFDMAIAALREQDATDKNDGRKKEWISVEDGRPKRMKRYFITYKFEGSDMRFYGEAMFHPEGGNGCVDRPHFSNEGVDGMYVTHWMEIPQLPLPEPPEGGADHAD